MRKSFITIIICSYLVSYSFSQERQQTLNSAEDIEQEIEAQNETIKKLQRFKISGYVQAQYQWGEKDIFH